MMSEGSEEPRGGCDPLRPVGDVASGAEFLTITDSMLYAIHEAGGLEVKEDGVSLREPLRR